MSESYSVEAYLKAQDQGFLNLMDKGIKGVENLDKSVGKTTSSIANIAKGVGAFKIVESGIGIMRNSLDSAISRFDTMQGFPKVLSAIGFSGEDSAKSVSKLADGIDGLPTKLDDVVSTTQRMSAITKNLNKSTDATLALNNAMLASGASGDQATRGMDQYIKMLSTGQVELDSWKTLQETMPIGLQLTAEAMGYVGEAAQNDLYTALKSGEKTFDEFQNKLIELGTGTGDLAELAKTNSEGIATSFSNLKNSASKGIANVIDEVDKLSTSVTGKNIAQNLDGMKVAVNKSFGAIVKTIKMSTPVVKLFGFAVDGTIKSAKFLSPVLIGLAAGFTALKAIEGLNSLMVKTDSLFIAAGMSGKALTITTQAHLAAQTANTTATKADIVAKAAQSGQITIGTALFGAMTGAISAGTVATTIATAATTAFGTTITVLTGPIGWIIGGIGLLTAGVAGLYKWFNRTTEAGKELGSQQEALVSSSDELNKQIDSEISARKDNISSIESSAKAYSDLVDKTEVLANNNNRTSAETKMLKANIEQLNSSVDGLGVTYDKENSKLSQNTELIKKRIDAQANQDKANLAMEESIRLAEQQHEVERKLNEVVNMRESWQTAIMEGTVARKQARDSIKELNEEEENLLVTQDALTMSIEQNNEVLEQSNQAVTQAIEDGNLRQVISYDNLNENQQRTVDEMKETFQTLADVATNAFEMISTESETNLNQMVEVMKHNQAAVAEWGENQAALLAWAGKNGYDSFIPFIESIGLDQAGVLAQMTQGIDSSNVEQANLLAELAKTYENGFGSATEAGKKAMGEGFSTLPTDIQNMVMPTADSITGNVKSVFEDLGSEVAKGAEVGIENGTVDVEKASANMAQRTSDSFKTELGIHSPSKKFTEYGVNITEGLVNGLDGESNTITNATKSMADDVVKPFDSIESKMEKIGEYIMSGLANGITANSSLAVAAANSTADQVKSTIQKAMEIHSPSRWTRNFVGKNMMVGWADGIEANTKTTTKAAQEASKRISDSISSNATDYKIGAISANQFKANLEALKRDGALTIAQRNNINTQLYNLEKESRDKAIKLANDRRKQVTKLNQGVLKANQDYLKKARSINEKLSKDIKTANANYKAHLSQMKDSIYRQVGLFDHTTTKFVTKQGLTGNLEGQLKQFKEWQKNMNALTKKIPANMAKELRAMGVDSAGEIKAMTTMSNAELNAYVKMWKEKNSLASKEATLQSKDALKQTQVDIKALTAAANKELKTAKNEWSKSLGQFKADAKQIESFKGNGNVLGKNVAQGLINGLKGMNGPVKSATNSLANQVVSTMKKSLGIHSPSRVMRDEVGRFIPEGVALGIDKYKGLVDRSMDTLVDTDSAMRALDDINGMINSSNINKINAESELTYKEAKESLNLQINIGKQKWNEFVDDVSETQGANSLVMVNL